MVKTTVKYNAAATSLFKKKITVEEKIAKQKENKGITRLCMVHL